MNINNTEFTSKKMNRWIEEGGNCRVDKFIKRVYLEDNRPNFYISYNITENIIYTRG
jgi:hypothetical protein